MGYTTGIKTAADASWQIVKTDGAGAWRRDGTTGHWTQCFNRDNSPAALHDMKPTLGDSDGTWEAEIAPGDPTRAYASWRHRIVKSVDSGDNWTLCTAVPQMMMNSNAQDNGSYQRLAFGKMAIDPTNADVVYWGAESQALNRTLDGFASYGAIASVPTPVSPYSRSTSDDRYCLIAIDETSSLTSGRHSVVYVASIGNGIYRSSDGGNTFSQISATLLYPANIQCIAGELWVFDYRTTGGGVTTTTNIYKYSAGSWGAAFGPAHQVRFIAVDPTDSAILYAGLTLYRSNNGGTSWTDIVNNGANITWVGHDAPLLANRRNLGKDLTASAFSVADGKIFWATGLGICYFDAANFRAATKVATAVPLLAHEDTAGIENIVPQFAYINRNGTGFLINQDVAIVRTTFDGAYPALPYPVSTLANGFHIDEAADDPSWLAAVISKNATRCAYSENDGITWQQFPVAPTTNFAGALAVGNAGNVVVFPGQNAWPRVTDDGGARWTDCTFSGFAKRVSPNISGWGFGDTSPDIFVVTADKQNPGTFYAYNYGSYEATADAPTRTTQRAATAGVWKSTDDGFNWTRVSTATTNGNTIIKLGTTGQHNQLRMSEGVLFLCAGQSGAGPYEPDGDDMFWRSTDGGVTWLSMPDIDEVNYFTFGKSAWGASYPALYVIGYIGGVRGLYRCLNANAATIGDCEWEALPASPRVIAEACIAGDPTTWGHLLIGYGGMSYEEAYYDYSMRFS